MSVIRVLGNDYKAAFESARSIIKKGLLAQELPECYVDENGYIHNGPNTFEFIDKDDMNDASKRSDFSISEDGASWFKNIRDIARNPGSTSSESNVHIWVEFLASISNLYHNKFFLVSCKKKNSDVDANKISETYRTYTDKIMKTFYPQISDWHFVAPFEGSAGFDNIYGLSLRLQVGDGVGKEVPVLGTLYLKQINVNRMMPLSADEAKMVEKSFESVDENALNTTSVKRSDAIKDTNATSNTLNLLFSELTRVIEEDSFGDYLVDCIKFDDDDESIINGILSRMQNDNKVLVCNQVEILSISHLNWEKYSYTVDDNRTGKSLFGIIGGIDGKMTMHCLGCNQSQDLIANNRIIFTDSESEERVTVVINPELDNLGLTRNETELIRKSGHFSSHYIKVGARCGSPRGKKACSRTVCKSNLISVETNEGMCDFCRECPYPEVLYKDGEGNIYHTPSLVFDTQQLKLVPKDMVANKPCQCCGRYVTRLNNNMYCDLCAKPSRADMATKKAAMDKYNKFKNLLPLRARMTSSNKIKMCFEDSEILLFTIDDKKYIYHKFWLEEGGYSRSPEDITGN